MNDRELRTHLIRLAHTHPEFRADLIPLLKQADFDAGSIGEDVPGPEGGPGSDAQKPWAKGEFTQQETNELGDRLESGALTKGQPITEPMKVASMKEAAQQAFRTARTAGKSPEEAVTAARAAMTAWKQAHAS